MTRPQVIAGGLTARSTASTERVLHPRAALSARAGITPTRVPSDMWVEPELLAVMRAPRALRAVA